MLHVPFEAYCLYIPSEYIVIFLVNIGKYPSYYYNLPINYNWAGGTQHSASQDLFYRFKVKSKNSPQPLQFVICQGENKGLKYANRYLKDILSNYKFLIL